LSYFKNGEEQILTCIKLYLQL